LKVASADLRDSPGAKRRLHVDPQRFLDVIDRSWLISVAALVQRLAFTSG
jgi:hypothetical protein